MTPDQLAELEALEKLATPAPWKNCEPLAQFEDYFVYDADDESICCCGIEGQDSVNAAFIAALRNAAPALFAAIREQGEEIERMTTRVKLADTMLGNMLWNAERGNLPERDAYVRCLKQIKESTEAALNPNPQRDAKGE